MLLRSLYVIAIGLLFAGVIGLGLEAFYSNPTYPTCERDEIALSKEGAGKISSDCQAQIERYDHSSDQVRTNKSFIYMGIAVVVIAISIFGLGKVEIIGDGVTLGGLFVLFVGLIQSLSTENDIVKFFTALAGLALVVFLSYWKFIRGHNVSEKD